MIETISKAVKQKGAGGAVIGVLSKNIKEE